MKRLERYLTKLFLDLAWDIIVLPFKAVYLFIRWLLFHKQVNADGYVVVRSKTGHDLLEHRVVAEKILGRRLEAYEVVHHINGRRDDNSVSNLCVMHSGNHDRYHEWYDWIRKTYGRFPRRETQLRKLRGSFNGTILNESAKKRKGGG